MVEFYLKLTLSRIEKGMSKDEALAKVPIKWREAVEAALDEQEGE